MVLHDNFKRPLRDLRISVTDRCNFRCTYCMPLDEYEWIKRTEILTYEEVSRLARLFASLGVDKIRLTGGEPLLRKNLNKLIKNLSLLVEIKDVCLTTNAALLAPQAAALKTAGLKRINVSLDTLQKDKFRQMTKRGNLDEVLEGLFAAKEQGFSPIKINVVIERGSNDDEIIDLVDFAKDNGFAIRFIEYMDVGSVNQWTSEKMVPKAEILRQISVRHRLREIGRNQENATSLDYEFFDGDGNIGFIASVTEPFCTNCSRVRLTADGKMVTCLFSQQGHDLKTAMRTGASDQDLQNSISTIWRPRIDRYSEERFLAMQSPSGYRPDEHKKIEMITLGG